MATFRLQLLGPPRVWRGDQPLAPGTRKALALLARLALDGAASRDSIAPWLWPDLDAAAARRNLRREVFRLRALALPIAEDADGALRLGADCDVDVHAFRAARAAGDGAHTLSMAAARALDGLDGLAGEAFEHWLRERRSALRHELLQARQELALEHAREGDVATALALWRLVLDEDPGQEAALAQAMTVLQQRGEIGAALALYERTAAALHRELELAPSPALQRQAAALRQAMLAPAAEAPPTPDAVPASVLPPPSLSRPPIPPGMPYVERPAAERALTRVLDSGRSAWLHGVAGAGKTRLACAVAQRRGAWLYLPCLPGDAGVPFSTVLRALRAMRQSADALPPWVRRELAPLLPELGEGHPMLQTVEARQRLLAALAEALRVLLADDFNAVVLDDWQWCDGDSAPLLAMLHDTTAACIVVYRSAQLPSPLLVLQRQVIDSGRGERVALEGLAEAETLALTRLLLAEQPAQPLALRLHRRTGGNPFFVIETLNLMFEREWIGPGQGSADSQDWPVPDRVRETVVARVRAQGESARRLLECASLLDGPFDAALLGGVAAATDEEVVMLLEHAEAARLVARDGGGYRFAHELLRQCLADDLSPARRQMLHARLAARLVERHASPAHVAAQFEGAQDVSQAVAWRLAAGDEALRLHALAEAQGQYEAALALRPQADDALRARLALAQVHRRSGDGERAGLELGEALVLSAQAAPPQRLEARLAWADHWGGSGRPQDGLAALDAMQGELRNAAPLPRAKALVVRARLLRFLGRVDESAACNHEAMELLEREGGGQLQLGLLLDEAVRRALARGAPAEAVALARRAIAVAEFAGDGALLSRVLTLLGVALIHSGDDTGQARHHLERALGLARQCCHVPAQRGAILNLIKLHTDRGDIDAARALLCEGETLAPHYETVTAEQAFAQARYFVLYMAGDIEAADAAARRLLELAEAVPDALVGFSSRHMVLDLYLHTGRLGEAQALLERSAAQLRDGQVHGHAELWSKQAWCSLRAGRLDAAETEWQLARAADARPEHVALRAWIGAALALARDDLATAATRLHTVALDGELPTELRAMLLVQHLVLRHRGGLADAAARAIAQRLLEEGRVPALEAAQLRSALAAV